MASNNLIQSILTGVAKGSQASLKYYDPTEQFLSLNDLYLQVSSGPSKDANKKVPTYSWPLQLDLSAAYS